MAKDIAQLGLAASLIVVLAGAVVGLTLIAGITDMSRAAAVFGLLALLAAFLLVFRFVAMSIYVWLGKPEGPDRGTGD